MAICSGLKSSGMDFNPCLPWFTDTSLYNNFDIHIPVTWLWVFFIALAKSHLKKFLIHNSCAYRNMNVESLYKLKKRMYSPDKSQKVRADVSFISLKKLLNKQINGCWFEMPWCSCEVSVVHFAFFLMQQAKFAFMLCYLLWSIIWIIQQPFCVFNFCLKIHITKKSYDIYNQEN